MQGAYIELPCDHHTMLTFMVCYCVCLYMHYLACRRGELQWAFVMLTSWQKRVCVRTPETSVD